MQGKHTWTAPERQRARDFANSLPEGRLDSARAKTRLPSASVDELVRCFSDNREQLSRLLFVFDVNKPDLARFFRQLKPSNDVLSVTTLNSKKQEELCAWFEAYLSQGWKGSARNALTEYGKQREDNADNLQRRELPRMKNTVFTTASNAQARDFLLRMDESHLSHIGQQSKLQIPDLGSVGGKAAKVEAILSAAAGQGGHYKLLTALGEMYTRVFLVEHWEQIAELFRPQEFGYNNDHMGCDKNTCQLFILWAWAHM